MAMQPSHCPTSAVVEIRDRNSLSEVALEWASATADFLSQAAPWRTFRWRDGQRHYSGTYWSATNRDHVIYESRLELARLLFADYDTTVKHVIAQPFFLRAKVNRRIRRHVPDFLLFADGLPRVVDVKPIFQGKGKGFRITFPYRLPGWFIRWPRSTGVLPVLPIPQAASPCDPVRA